ncbi:MAG: hypothetical protein C4560_00390 [Nitrospiraceae bacterium]|nr:MAG: hypothetical protein C4560_00390 [Nitrospiraceae bacterium]
MLISDSVMTYKRNLLNIVIFTIVMVSVLLSVNFIVDPFQHFRKAGFYKVTFDNDIQRYLNSGLLKNYKYDCIITGTSMVQNFSKKEVDSLLKVDSIKVPFAGGTAHEFSQLLGYAISQKKVKTVIYGLDVFSFAGDPLRVTERPKFPFYLYSDSILNDIRYLVDFKNLLNQMTRVLSANIGGNVNTDLNEAYSWYKEAVFSKKVTLDEWRARKERFDTSFKYENYTYDKLETNFSRNILPHIQQNPKIKFIIFFPPYSILAWKDIQEKGWMNDALRLKKYIFEATRQMEHIEIYDFQDIEDITHSLDNYADLTHHSHVINRIIAESFVRNEYLLNESNIDYRLDNLRQQVNKYRLP